MDEEMNSQNTEAAVRKLETPDEIIEKYQQSLRTSEQLKAEILEGLKTGEPLEKLFLMSTRIISLMTDNPNFAQLCEKHLKEGDPE